MRRSLLKSLLSVFPIACFHTLHLEVVTTGSIQVAVANLDRRKSPEGVAASKQVHQEHRWKMQLPVVWWGQDSQVSLWWTIRLYLVHYLFVCLFQLLFRNVAKALVPFGGCEEVMTSTRPGKCNPLPKWWTGFCSLGSTFQF